MYLESIHEIKAKMVAKEKEWDTLVIFIKKTNSNFFQSTTTKKNAVTLEERIAKHVADEILRNHTVSVI